MANKFEFRVEAVDKFTKVFQHLNDRASKAVRPVQSVYKQVGALSREMHLDKFAAGMERVSSLAPTMARSLGLAVGPMESMLGIGAAGGIIGGLTAAAAAVGTLSYRAASAGFNVTRMANSLGVSTDGLQRLRAVAERVKVPAEAIDQTMQSLGDTLQNARMGRDPAALAALNRLGIGVKVTKDGLVDVEGTLVDVENIMQRFGNSPAMRNAIADALHIPREVIPMLQLGSQEIRRLGDDAERLGQVQGKEALQWENDFTAATSRLQAQLNGVALSVGANLVPKLTGFLNGMNDVIAKGAANAGADPRAYGLEVPQGPMRGPLTGRAPAGVFSGLSAPTGPAPGSLRQQAQFTPAELAQQDRSEASDENLRQLREAIRKAPDPVRQGQLMEQERQVLELRVKLHMDGVPPGTRATAHASNGQQVSLAIGRAMETQ